MSKFILLYKGPVPAMRDMTPEQGEAINQLWMAWGGKVGAQLVDFGNPFGGRTSYVADGSTGTASDLNGYTIVEADSLDAAQALCDGHPFLHEAGNEFSIDVYELAPVPM